MSNSVTLIVQNPKILPALKDHYQKEQQRKVPPYALFSAKKKGVTITAYQSGKVLFQGAGAEREAEQISQLFQLPNTPAKNPATSSATLPKGFSSWSIIGSDEVGNGSYFGPLVVCAFYAPKESHPLLKELGVKDSKELSDTDIRRIAQDLVHVAPHRLLVVTPEKYNDIQPEYNAVRMKVALHNKALGLLIKEISPIVPDGILIDQFTPEANYRKYLRQEKAPVTEKLYFTTKGENQHIAVAAASILCRARFLTELDNASKELGLPVPSGAGSKADLIAAKILRQGGVPLLGKYAKLHFANTAKAQKIARQ